MPNVSAISIYVTDPESAATFYTNALGFHVAHTVSPDLIVLAHEGVDLVLCRAEKPATIDYPTSSGTVLGIKTDDIEKSIGQLKAANATVLFDEPQPFPGGRFIAFRDPSGNVLEMLEFGGE